MILPRQMVPVRVARAGGAPRRGIAPSTVAFSPNWDHYSWSTNHGVDRESERQLILEMIRNSSSDAVKAYARDDQCNVYVRTGIHTSSSDSSDHVQVQLGLASSPWTSTRCPGATCHITYHGSANTPYPTSCFTGLHSGGGKKK